MAERTRRPRPGPRTFAAFASRDFRLLWANNFSYALVQGIQRLTFVLLAGDLTRNEFTLGLVVFALGIPVFFLTLPAGVLTDRADRRLLLVGSQLLVLAASLLTALFIWADRMSVPAMLAMAVLVGVGVAVGQPVRQALVPAIVPPERLLNAISLNSLGQNVSQIAGPAIAGFAILFWGIGGSFAAQAALMGAGLLFLIPLRVPPVERAVSVGGRRLREMLGEIGDGFVFAWRAADVRALFVLLLATALVIMGTWQTLLPRVAEDQLGADEFAITMLFAGMGAGTIVSSLVLASMPRLRNAGGWFTCTLVTGGSLAVGLGLSDSYALTMTLMVASGLNAGFFMNLNLTLIQSHTPNAMMGRIMSIYTLVMLGGSPFGALIAGGGAAWLDAGRWFAISGAATAAVAVAFLIAQPSLRRMPSHPETPVAAASDAG